MSAGLLYSIITMPFETAKNRMAFQSVDKVTGTYYTDVYIKRARERGRESTLGINFWTG